MNSGYYPSVVSHINKIQTQSGGFQTPFYFGGSQVPTDLQLQKGTYSGAGFTGDKPPSRKGQPIFSQNGRPIVRPLTILK